MPQGESFSLDVAGGRDFLLNASPQAALAAVRVYHQRWGPRYRIERQAYGRNLLALVEQGSLRLVSPAGRREAGPGSLVLLLQGEGHVIATGSSSVELRALVLDGTACREHLRRLVAPATGIQPFAAPRLWTELHELMLQVAQAEDPRDQPILDALAGALLELCGRWRGQEPAVEPDDLLRVRRLIAQRSQEFASATALAAAAGLSPWRLSRLFPGQGAWRAVLEHKVARAANLLRATRDPIGAIAGRCGFNDAATFCRVFRRLRGCTPGAWRAG